MTALLLLSAGLVVASVFGGWLIWFSPWARRQRELHDARWAEYVEARPDGLTGLQRECERRLSEALVSRGLSLRNRRIAPDVLPEAAPSTSGIERGQRTIIAEVPELDARVWLYPDQTDIFTPEKKLRLEEWDTETPAEHLEAVVSFISSVDRVAHSAPQGELDANSRPTKR